MAEILQSIKVEGTSPVKGCVEGSVTFGDLPTVKVKLENEAETEGGTNDSGTRQKKIKVEKIDPALDSSTTSCGRSGKTNVSIKEEDANIYLDLVKKIKVEEGLASVREDETGGTGIERMKMKVEKTDPALDTMTTCCGQSATTSVSVKEECAGICFDLVKKIKVKEGLGSVGEDGTNDIGIGMLEFKGEEAYASSRDLTSSLESTSRFTSNSQFVDTSALTKEEDLGVCFEEEEGSSQVSPDFCASLEDKVDLGDEGLYECETEMIQVADASGEIGSSLRESAVSSIVDSQLVITECDKSDGVTGDPSVSFSEKCFHCADCSAKFKTISHLKKHAVVHSNERPLACTQCSSKFKLKSNLNQHMKTHSDERLFCCSHCASSFKIKRVLKSHLRIHSGEKPYTCTHTVSCEVFSKGRSERSFSCSFE